MVSDGAQGYLPECSGPYLAGAPRLLVKKNFEKVGKIFNKNMSKIHIKSSKWYTNVTI